MIDDKSDKDSINYFLPDKSAEEYATNALTFLEVIHARYRRLLPYFIEPNAVLTLSGVRSFNTYTGFESTVDLGAVIDLANMLAKHDVFLVLDSKLKRPANKYIKKSFFNYDTVNYSALDALKNQYPFVNISKPELPLTLKSFDIWLKGEMARLSKQINNGDLGARAKRDQCDASHTLFGILFGYPLEAIIDVSSEEQLRETDYSINMIDANIENTDIYRCAQPIYLYRRQRTGDQTIVAHSKLWSQILGIVYSSSLHNKVSKEKYFMKLRSEIDE